MIKTMKDTKICTKCGRELPLSEFHKGNGKDGYAYNCKECKKEYERLRRIQNKEKVQKIAKEGYDKWVKSHPLEAKAKTLLSGYYQSDKKYNRGKGDLTYKWIVENIFTKPCAHCGKTGWQVIGCNRLDNSKPHTKDNVEPCCEECNRNLAPHVGRKKKCIGQIDKISGEVIRTWYCLDELNENGYNGGSVSRCCNGKYYGDNSYKNYFWKRPIIF